MRVNCCFIITIIETFNWSICDLNEGRLEVNHNSVNSRVLIAEPFQTTEALTYSNARPVVRPYTIFHRRYVGRGSFACASALRGDFVGLWAMVNLWGVDYQFRYFLCVRQGSLH